MPDLLTQLHDYADALADTVEPVPAATAMTVDAPPTIAGRRRRARRRWWELAAAAVVVVVLVGWATAQARDGRLPLVSGRGLDAALAGRTFHADSMRVGDGVAAPAYGSLSFSQGQVEVDLCNRSSTGYALDGDHLEQVGYATMGTAMACGDGHDPAVDEWARVLSASPRISLDGDRLTLTTDDRVVELVDADAAPTLAELDTRAFVAVSATDDGRPRALVHAGSDPEEADAVLLQFSAATPGSGRGSIAVIGGCSGGQSAAFSIDGGRLHTVLIDDSTGPGCDPARADQGAWLIDLVTSSPLLTLDGDRLTLANGATTLHLVEPVPQAPDSSASSSTSTSSPVDRDEEAVGPLTGTTWYLDAMMPTPTIQDLDTGPAAPFITFQADTTSVPGGARIVGHDGCRPFTGSLLSVVGPDLRFGGLVVDPIGSCPAGYGQIASAIDSALAGDATYQIDAGRLRIIAGDETLVFRAS